VQGFIGVDVADPGQDALIQQQVLYGGLAKLQGFYELILADKQRVGSEVFQATLRKAFSSGQ
jgi:hypothetical protein